MDDRFLAIREIFDMSAADTERAREDDPKVGRDAVQSQAYGRKALDEGRYAAAVGHFRRALEQGGGDPATALAELGAAYAAGDQVPEAYRQFRRAQRVKESGEVEVALSSLCRQYGRLNDAVAHLRQAVTQEPHNAFFHHKLAETLRSMGYRKEAVGSAESAVACAPSESFYHYWLGDLFLELRRYEAAAGAFHAAIELSPGDPKLFALASVALWGAGRRPEALRAARLAGDIDPNDPVYAGLLEALLRAARETEEADVVRPQAERMGRFDVDTLDRLLAPVDLRTDVRPVDAETGADGG